MSQENHKENSQPKILWFGDLVHESGFGRIGNEVTQRLHQRGYDMIGASIPWAGYPWTKLPFPIWGMGGQDIWARLTGLTNEEKPDVVVVCQDFPYAQTAFHQCAIDWSVTKLIIVTPIDGTPIHPEWLKMVDKADATMVISRFGVEAMRLADKHVELLHPGADPNTFYPAQDGEVAEIRQKLGLTEDNFVVGMFAMNQGRKAVSATVSTFAEFSKGKPEARLYLDMDKASPMGWELPRLVEQMGLSPDKVLYKEQAIVAGIEGIRERMLLMDVHTVVSHREGFGLPLLESMACKITTMALDWCSGSEIVGGGKGMLIRRLDYMEYGTWGHARDAFPDMKDWLAKLNTLYHKPDERAAIAAKGYGWAKEHTWDVAADQFETTLKQVLSNQVKERASEPEPFVIPSPTLTDFGRVESRPAAAIRPDGVHHSSDLQQPAAGNPVHEIAGADGRPEPDGNTRPG